MTTTTKTISDSQKRDPQQTYPFNRHPLCCTDHCRRHHDLSIALDDRCYLQDNAEIFTSLNPIPSSRHVQGYIDAMENYGGKINIWGHAEYL
jgi:hypothetical protein